MGDGGVHDAQGENLHGAVAVVLDGLDLNLPAAHGGGWMLLDVAAHRGATRKKQKAPRNIFPRPQ